MSVMSGSIIDISDDESDNNLQGYNIFFTWDYPDDWCLKDVKDTIFHVLDHTKTPRSESQFISNCIQSSGAGVLLVQPNPELESTPCELQFAQHQKNRLITKILVVSEAKHVELYLNHMYAKTSKGCMITARKGKKAALYENEFDLTSQNSGIQNIKVKLISLGESCSIKLQTVLIWVTKVSTLDKQMASDGLNLGSIKDMVKSIGMLVSELDNDKKFTDMSYVERQDHITDKQNHIEVLQNLMQLTGINYACNDQTNSKQNHSQVQSALSYAVAHSKPADFSYNYEAPMQNDDRLITTIERSSHQRRKSKNNEDAYDGFGTPNPMHESVLANAILNNEASKHIAESRAMLIEEQNFDQAQAEYLNNLVNSTANQNGTISSHVITAVGGGYAPEKPPRKLVPYGEKKKPRPHSLPALAASASEIDFTELLSNLMKEESTESLQEDQMEDETTNVDLRWQAYLRSRVRASQRITDQNPAPMRPISSISLPGNNRLDEPTEHQYNQYNSGIHHGQQHASRHHQWSHVNRTNDQISTTGGLSRSSSVNYGSTKNFPIGRSEHKSCTNCSSLSNLMNMSIKASEERIKNHIDRKFHEMRTYIDDRLHKYHEVYPDNYVQVDEQVYRSSNSSVV